MGLVAGGWWGGPRSVLLQKAGSLWALTWTGPPCALCFVLCALRSALREWLRVRPENSGKLMGFRPPAWAWARELAQIARLSCAAFSHTWKSVLSLELIDLLFDMFQSVWNFGYTPRKPLSSVHFTTLKSLVSVLRRQGSSRSLYIDCCFANRMTERQTVQWVPVFVLLLYVLLVFALCFPYFLFCTSDLSPSLPILLILLFLIFLIIKKNEKQRNK